MSEITPELARTRFGRFFLYDATDKTIELSVDAQLDGPNTASGSVSNPGDDLISANLNLLLVDELNQPIFAGALLLSSSGDVWILDFAGNYVEGVQVNLNDYHRLCARIDFSTREVEFFVDNLYITTLQIPKSITTNIFATGAPAMFAVNDRKLLNRNLYKAYFDNYCVSTDSCVVQWTQ